MGKMTKGPIDKYSRTEDAYVYRACSACILQVSDAHTQRGMHSTPHSHTKSGLEIML